MAQRLYNSRTQLHFMKQYILLKCPRYNKNIINYQHKFLMQSKWKLGFRGLFFFFFFHFSCFTSPKDWQKTTRHWMWKLPKACKTRKKEKEKILTFSVLESPGISSVFHWNILSSPFLSTSCSCVFQLTDVNGPCHYFTDDLQESHTSKCVHF